MIMTPETGYYSCQIKTPLRFHLLQSNLPGPLYLSKLIVLVNIAVLKKFSRNYFSFFFVSRNKHIEKAELERVSSEYESVPFSPITIPSILLIIFSFFLGSKDFLLLYSTLKSHVLTNNRSHLLVSFQSQYLALHPTCFFYFITYPQNRLVVCHPYNTGSVGYLINFQSLTV